MYTIGGGGGGISMKVARARIESEMNHRAWYNNKKKPTGAVMG